jgi:ABC-type Fe3+-hydroxamate transport system substrate-binding protein
VPVGSVQEAVLTHYLGRPDVIRQRAQHAATISGAAATALIAALGLSNVYRLDAWVSVSLARRFSAGPLLSRSLC